MCIHYHRHFIYNCIMLEFSGSCFCILVIVKSDYPFSYRPTPELMQETHSCFFSLIRDVICSTPDHRMSLVTLEDRLKAWQENPISPLNDWYCIAADSWLLMLSSAISFLSGDFPGMWAAHTGKDSSDLPVLLIHCISSISCTEGAEKWLLVSECHSVVH